MGTSGYAARLKAAMDRRPVSRRKLSFELAGETGNKQSSEYRTLGKYLSGGEVPSSERAQILARRLAEPGLAEVPSNGERRRGRQAELEERVVELEALLDRLTPQVQGIDDRVSVLEQQERPRRKTAETR